MIRLSVVGDEKVLPAVTVKVRRHDAKRGSCAAADESGSCHILEATVANASIESILHEREATRSAVVKSAVRSRQRTSRTGS